MVYCSPMILLCRRAGVTPRETIGMKAGMSAFRTLDDVQVENKRVLVRVDLNVPAENGIVTDATRLERIVPTLLELARARAKVILLAHFGRPKGVDPKESLKPVAAKLAEILKRPV